jgi:superfamily II DNA or RNA helicase
MLQLRGYQLDFVASIQAAWRTYRAVLGVLPTGAGKTVCFSALIHDHTGAAAAVVHRKEIVNQISLSLARLGVRHRVIAPAPVVTRIRRRQLRLFGQSYVDPHAQVGVVSVQTLTSAASGRDRPLQRWLDQITLAVFDEGHHYVTQGLWARAVERMTAARLLFVTATPERADGRGLGADVDGFAEHLVTGPDTQWLIRRGYLSPFRYVAPQTDLDVSNVPVTATGDLNTRVLRARVVESHLVGDVVRHYHQYARARRAIVFATDVQTAEEIAEAFQGAGVASAALSGKTDHAERDAKLDELEGGQLQVLVNVDLFDEGFDVPAVEAVILARPTESLAKFLQMVGRALRPVYAEGCPLLTAEDRREAIGRGNKPTAIIIDPVRNWERHGMPNWPRTWSLYGRDKGSRGANQELIPQRVCVLCTQPYERFYTVCPHCGAAAPVPSGRTTPEQVDGDLTELDVDGMAALFAALDRAELSDTDYGIDQMRRGIPEIGRRADLRRHQEAKHRRQVLRELVAWWMGAQPPERPMAERYRRFYHRFGIDIGTAFTLKARDTDALLARIQQQFTEDL